MPAIEPIAIPPSQWTYSGTGRYRGIADIRDLLQVEHPWENSEQDCYGEWRATIEVPEHLLGRALYVSFYQSDDYQAGPTHKDWQGVQAFVGHRFKQLWANGVLVWEEDVARAEMAALTDAQKASPTAPTAYHDPYRVVSLGTPSQPTLDLRLCVVDKVASTVELPGDAYGPFAWKRIDADATRHFFASIAFFGDLFVSGSPEPLRPVRTHGAKAPVRAAPGHCRSAQPNAPKAAAIPLLLQTPGPLPTEGHGVRCGVPFPEGLLPAGTPLALAAPSGLRVPVNSTETSHWPDGSLRWALLEFVARECGTWQVIPGESPAPCTRPVTVTTQGDCLIVESGGLRIDVGGQRGEGLFEQLLAGGVKRLGAGRLSIKLNRHSGPEPYVGHRLSVAVERSGPLCAVLRYEGEFRSASGVRFGSWQARLYVWAELPHLVVEWTLVNESDQATAMLLDWSARFQMERTGEAVADFGEFTPKTLESIRNDPFFFSSNHLYRLHLPDMRAIELPEASFLSCWQHAADQALVCVGRYRVGEAPTAPGFVRLTYDGRGLVGSMRWFHEEFPKGIVVVPHELQLATLPEALDVQQWWYIAPTVLIGRGEAKRQTLALWVADKPVAQQEAERFNACVQDPPHLYDGAWFLRSQTFDTSTTVAPAGWEAVHARISDPLGVDALRLGHREYWDTAWGNNYRGRGHLGALRYVETGDPRWYRYFEAVCRHNCDVDIIHYCPEHPEWVGGMHKFSIDHTSGTPEGGIGLNTDELLEHYLLTGDRDSLNTAAGVAHDLLRWGRWDRSARNVGWPLAQLSKWYDQTHDASYLAVCHELARSARAYVEPRRGLFVEIHGSYNNVGGVPFMMAYLAFGLIRYCQVTGSQDAAEVLCDMADGLIAECEQSPGSFLYSPMPELNTAPDSTDNREQGNSHWDANLGGLFGYAYLLTGERRYRAAAQRCYDALLIEQDPCGSDHSQLVGWMLRALFAAEGDAAPA